MLAQRRVLLIALLGAVEPPPSYFGPISRWLARDRRLSQASREHRRRTRQVETRHRYQVWSPSEHTGELLSVQHRAHLTGPWNGKFSVIDSRPWEIELTTFRYELMAIQTTGATKLPRGQGVAIYGWFEFTFKYANRRDLPLGL